jgi:hypothetical protein
VPGYPRSDDLQSLIAAPEGSARLVDIAAAFEGPRSKGQVIGPVKPDPEVWSRRFSLEDRSTASSGRRWTAAFFATTDDLQIAPFARCDELMVGDGRGASVDTPVGIGLNSAGTRVQA